MRKHIKLFRCLFAIYGWDLKGIFQRYRQWRKGTAMIYDLDGMIRR